MKHINSFEKFLEDEVNLNQTRVDRIKDGIVVVEAFIKDNPVFKDHFVAVVPQGSYRQKTIIKPLVGEGDFDVDILLELEEFQDWTPKEYLEALHNEFKASGIYEDIVDRRGKTRCVTLDYADDFHIDIIPTIRTQAGCFIMNKATDQFEPTDGDGYAQWFERANSISTNDLLIKVVRLSKYLRDREEMPIKSVMLTTILGNVVQSSETRFPYNDLPTALKVLFGRLDDYLQSYSTPPDVKNPVLPAESFTRHWNQENFEKTKNKVHEFRKKIDEAYDDTSEESSIDKWKEVFGDSFALVDEENQSMALAVIFPLGNTNHCEPITSISRGERLDPSSKIKIAAHLYSLNGRKKFRGIASDASIMDGLSIRFKAELKRIRKPYEIYWQVVNTGSHAEQDVSGPRGNFFKAKKTDGNLNYDELVNWESSLYTGKHWIEAFVIKDTYCIARSGKFFINIKNRNH